MANVTVKEGLPAEFHAEASGVPTPMMSWQKDGKMVGPADQHFRVATDGGRSSLFIDRTMAADDAWYQCTAANISGTASNRGRLIVQGQSHN